MTLTEMITNTKMISLKNGNAPFNFNVNLEEII